MTVPFSISMHSKTGLKIWPPLARTLATRIGNAAEYPGSKKFVLDFSNGSGLDRNNPDSVEPVVSITNGNLNGRHLQRNDPSNAWRVSFDVEPIDKTKPVEMRCFLQSGGLPRSETWTYFWNP